MAEIILISVTGLFFGFMALMIANKFHDYFILGYKEIRNEHGVYTRVKR